MDINDQGIKVIKAGLLTTVQDLGRYGYQKSGIIVSGAMDTLALRIGNLLLGNKEEEAGLEITLLGPSLNFEIEQVIAITGADLSPTVDGQPVPMWRSVSIPKGAQLSFGKPIKGCRAYLCVKGGFKIESQLGSLSTYLQAKIGGWQGRALKPGDLIPFNSAHTVDSRKQNWSVPLKLYPDLSERKVRIVKGPEFELFTLQSIEDFLNTPYLISKETNRMGYKLEGKSLSLSTPKEMLSTAVTFGTIQVPVQGQPIILMADHQTTGGYPRIGQVITADLTMLAQLQTGDHIHFQVITLQEAQELLIQKEQQMKQLKQTISLKHA